MLGYATTNPTETKQLAIKIMPDMQQYKLLETITEFYIKSGDFNGYPLYLLRCELGIPTPDLVDLLRSLITDRKIDIVCGNMHSNPHIRAFSTITSEEQLKFLDELELDDHFCLYPSAEVLATIGAEQHNASPYTKELALGVGQLDFRSFDLSVLEYYRNDPRYLYRTDAINGQISISDEYYESNAIPTHDQTHLQSFGFSYDEDLNRAVAVFVRYLHDLSPEHQQLWKAKQLNGRYCLHPDYYRSSILGDWGTKLSIFSAFCQELGVINQMADLIGYAPFFHKTFQEEMPKEFGFLLRPTLKEFHSFAQLLDKMMSENINKNFFKGDIETEEDSPRADGKIVVQQLGTITLLDRWVRKKFRPSDPKPLDEMLAAFRKVRNLRQAPAHKLDDNRFDQQFFKDQRRLILDAYEAVRTFRLLLANHPSVRANPPDIGEYLFKGEIWDI